MDTSRIKAFAFWSGTIAACLPGLSMFGMVFLIIFMGEKESWSAMITCNKLRRYWLRCLEKADFDDALDDELTMPQYLDLLNGRAIPYDQAGIQRIMMRAYHLIGETGQSVTKLATLLRILHYKTNCAWTDQRIEISNRLADVREQELILKKSSSRPSGSDQSAIRNPNSAIPRRSDHLGPLAVSLEDIRARATAMWGPHPAPPNPNLKPAPNTLGSAGVSPAPAGVPAAETAPQSAPCEKQALINTAIHGGEETNLAAEASVSTLSSPSLNPQPSTHNQHKPYAANRKTHPPQLP